MRRWYFLFLVLLLMAIGQQNIRADDAPVDRPSFKEGECDEKRAEKAARLAYGWTTLTLAVLYNDIPRVKELLDLGGNVNADDKLSRRLLDLALQHDLDEMSLLLIERGAHYGTTACNKLLPVVLQQKNFEKAKQFFQKSADPTSGPADERGNSRTLMQWAMDMKRPDIVQFLKEQGVKEEAVSQATSPSISSKDLHRAAQTGDVERVRMLLEQGSDVEARDKDGLTPLVLAVGGENWREIKQIGVVKLLLEHGAFIKPSEKEARSLFEIVIRNQDTAMTRLLLQKGYNSNGEPSWDRDRPPLFWVVQTGSLEMVKLLIDAGANLQARFYGDKNALDYAYMKGETDLVEYFEKKHNMTRSAPNSELGESREVSFQSEKYGEEIDTGKLSLDRYRIEKEINCFKDGSSQDARIWRKKNYYLKIQNCPDRILLGGADIEENGESSTILIGAKDLTLKWLQEERLIQAKWENSYPGNGAWSEDQNLLLPVEGNRIGTPFCTCLKTFGKMGQGNYYHGEEEWTSGENENEFILTRTQSHDVSASRSMDYQMPSRILRMGESNGETVFVIDSGQKIQYTFRLLGNKLFCISAKKYFLNGNEVPMINIAESAGLTLPRLWGLNPGTKGDLFCKGTLCLGETGLLKSAPLPEN